MEARDGERTLPSFFSAHDDDHRAASGGDGLSLVDLLPFPWQKALYRTFQVWDQKYTVLSPDVDGLLSGLLVHHFFPRAVCIGLYDTKTLVGFAPVHVPTSDLYGSPAAVAASGAMENAPRRWPNPHTLVKVAKRALWIDCDMDNDLLCIGQHVVAHHGDEAVPGRNPNSFNPNLFFGQGAYDSFHGVMNAGEPPKRDKYHAGTVHFLLAFFQHVQALLALHAGRYRPLPPLPVPVPGTVGYALLVQADSMWVVNAKYVDNAQTWNRLMFLDGTRPGAASSGTPYALLPWAAASEHYATTAATTVTTATTPSDAAPPSCGDHDENGTAAEVTTVTPVSIDHWHAHSRMHHDLDVVGRCGRNGSHFKPEGEGSCLATSDLPERWKQLGGKQALRVHPSDPRSMTAFGRVWTYFSAQTGWARDALVPPYDLPRDGEIVGVPKEMLRLRYVREDPLRPVALPDGTLCSLKDFLGARNAERVPISHAIINRDFIHCTLDFRTVDPEWLLHAAAPAAASSATADATTAIQTDDRGPSSSALPVAASIHHHHDDDDGADNDCGDEETDRGAVPCKRARLVGGDEHPAHAAWVAESAGSSASGPFRAATTTTTENPAANSGDDKSLGETETTLPPTACSSFMLLPSAAAAGNTTPEGGSSSSSSSSSAVVVTTTVSTVP